jgi:hypothetical protein
MRRSRGVARRCCPFLKAIRIRRGAKSGILEPIHARSKGDNVLLRPKGFEIAKCTHIALCETSQSERDVPVRATSSSTHLGRYDHNICFQEIVRIYPSEVREPTYEKVGRYKIERDQDANPALGRVST